MAHAPVKTQFVPLVQHPPDLRGVFDAQVRVQHDGFQNSRHAQPLHYALLRDTGAWAKVFLAPPAHHRTQIKSASHVDKKGESDAQFPGELQQIGQTRFHSRNRVDVKAQRQDPFGHVSLP
jgi:hypothetical protein